MIEIEKIHEFMQNILHLPVMLFMFSIGIWEIYIASYYQNTKILLASESQNYNFILIVSVMNILNGSLLLTRFINKTKQTLEYFIILGVINLIIGLWNCQLYYHINAYGRFNNVVIIEFNLFMIKCIIFLIIYTVILFNSVYTSNDSAINAGYTVIN
jgi:hypothetical protein